MLPIRASNDAENVEYCVTGNWIEEKVVMQTFNVAKLCVCINVIYVEIRCNYCHDPLPVGIFPVAGEYRNLQEDEDMAEPHTIR